MSRVFVVLSLIAFHLPSNAKARTLTDKQIWDYVNEYKHEEAAKILGKELDSLIKTYSAADAKAKPAIEQKVLKTFYNLGWCQFYGRFYLENIKSYMKLLKLKIPAAKWRGKMLWTVRSGFAVGAWFAAAGKYKSALKWIDWAEKLYKADPYQKKNNKSVNPFAEFYNNGYDFHGFKLFLMKKTKLRKKKPKYTMTVLSIIYPNIDYTAVFWGVKKGRHKRSYTWTSRDYINLNISQAMARIAVEAMSNGDLSLKFINKKVKTRIYHHPKKKKGIYFNKAAYRERAALIKANPADIYFSSVISNDAGATGHGGGRDIKIYSRPDAAAYWTTLVHEFFHCVESYFGYKPHIYRIKNGVPGWKGTLWDQMDYYSWRFRKGILNKVKLDTKKYGYSGWISRFNWGPKSLRTSWIKTKPAP